MLRMLKTKKKWQELKNKTISVRFLKIQFKSENKYLVNLAIFMIKHKTRKDKYKLQNYKHESC